MRTKDLLTAVKQTLREAFGERLWGVVLYGSEARGQAGPDSDVDLLVLLNDTPREPHDSRLCVDVLYDLVLESGRPIHAEPIGRADYEANGAPLYVTAKREGVLL